MATLAINLTARGSEIVKELARQTGKTPDELVNEAVERLSTSSEEEERRKFEEWREAARRVAGIWKDRDDLPDFSEVRKSWDRGFGARE